MLNSVPDREEIRQMDRKQLNELSSEIRGFLIDKVSKKLQDISDRAENGVRSELEINPNNLL